MAKVMALRFSGRLKRTSHTPSAREMRICSLMGGACRVRRWRATVTLGAGPGARFAGVSARWPQGCGGGGAPWVRKSTSLSAASHARSEEHTSELQSPDHLVCRLLLEKKKKKKKITNYYKLRNDV